MRNAFLGTLEDYYLLLGKDQTKEIEWLDVSCGYEEILQKIEEQKYLCLLTMKKDNFIANQVLWECETLNEVMIVDSDDPYEVEVKKGKFSNDIMWNYISVNGATQIEEGGFYHCFNNQPFSQEEIKEFTENTYLKLQAYLSMEKNAMEIGCASGITMFRLQPYFKTYIGVDMASVSLKKNSERAKQNGIDNIELFQCEANKVGQLAMPPVDVVIMNSVIQHFPGINYLREVIMQCLSLMSDEGIFYIGDVMDLKKRRNLVRDALLYKECHPNASTRTDYSDDLCVCREYFEYLAGTVDGIYKIEISDKIGEIRNEMTDYRYDVILHYKRNTGTMKNCVKKVQSAERIM